MALFSSGPLEARKAPNCSARDPHQLHLPPDFCADAGRQDQVKTKGDYTGKTLTNAATMVEATASFSCMEDHGTELDSAKAHRAGLCGANLAGEEGRLSARARGRTLAHIPANALLECRNIKIEFSWAAGRMFELF